jgi:hypothetical protein
MLRIEATTRLPRTEMIARVSQAMQEAVADIIDFRFFSNITLFISAEVGSTRVSSLRNALIDTGLKVADRSLASLDQYINEAFASEVGPGIVPFHLVVTFIHTEPDLRITVPAVPG